MGRVYGNAARVLVWLGLLDTAMQQFLAQVHGLISHVPELSTEAPMDMDTVKSRVERHMGALPSDCMQHVTDQMCSLWDMPY
jgi:hypothetical protein